MYSKQFLKAKKASFDIAAASSEKKNRILKNICLELKKNKQKIINENKKDLLAAEKKGTSKSVLDRLEFNSKRIEGSIESVNEIINMKDPVGKVLEKKILPNKLRVEKIVFPMGLIGIIYENRPNVTIDSAAICIKSGNAVILKGDKAAINSNKLLVILIKKALRKEKISSEVVQFLNPLDEKSTIALVKAKSIVDLVIPRGGPGLIAFIEKECLVPWIGAGAGNCNIFIDQSADFKKAEKIVINAKVQRPSVCNAAENLLVHEKISMKFLPMMIESLRKNNVVVLGDNKVKKIVPDVQKASEKDWSTEFLDLKIAIKVVKDTEEAIDFINKYGTNHSESIISKNKKNIDLFLRKVDSSAVYANASTRFTDGQQFGKGGEIGISTQKLHSRGPMSVEELTTYKYVIRGTGQIRT